MPDLPAVTDELYALLPGEFVAARNARAAEARGSGDRELAEAITRLPKPAAAAWVVNMLVRHRPDEVEQVLALGESLRAAQQELDAAQLRELATQRRRLTAAVTRTARALASELGHAVSGGVVEQVESTLHAAMVDAGAADAVRAGRLTRPLVATGFGSVDVTSAMATRSGSTAGPRAASRPELSLVPDDTTAREQAQERATRAAAAFQEAESAAEGSRHRVRELSAKSLELAGRLQELRRQVAEQEQALGAVEDELEEAETAREAREGALATARAKAREAGRALDALS